MKITVYTFTIDDEHGMRTLVFPTAAERNAAIAERGNIPGDPASPDWLDEQEDEIEAWRQSSALHPLGWEEYLTWDEQTIDAPEAIREARSFLDSLLSLPPAEAVDLLTNAGQDVLDDLNKTLQP